MIAKKFVFYSIRLDMTERATLQRLADQTGRTPASVLRRLLSLADTPEARRLLGDPDPKAAEVQT